MEVYIHYFYCYIHPGLRVLNPNLWTVAEIYWMCHTRWMVEWRVVFSEVGLWLVLSSEVPVSEVMTSVVNEGFVWLKNQWGCQLQGVLASNVSPVWSAQLLSLSYSEDLLTVGESLVVVVSVWFVQGDFYSSPSGTIIEPVGFNSLPSGGKLLCGLLSLLNFFVKFNTCFVSPDREEEEKNWTLSSIVAKEKRMKETKYSKNKRNIERKER